MTLPIILFGLVVAILLGVLFHLLHAGGGIRLLLYVGLSILGFALGQWVDALVSWKLYMFGALDLGMGVIGSALVLALGDWLSRIEPKNKSGV